MTADTLILAAAALSAVLALVWLAQRLARATGLAPGATAGGGRVAVVQALALDTRRRLHLVRCDGRHVLLLTGGGSDVVVGWLEETRP